jgi:hypothetical protein
LKKKAGLCEEGIEGSQKAEGKRQIEERQEAEGEKLKRVD